MTGQAVAMSAKSLDAVGAEFFGGYDTGVSFTMQADFAAKDAAPATSAKMHAMRAGNDHAHALKPAPEASAAPRHVRMHPELVASMSKGPKGPSIVG